LWDAVTGERSVASSIVHSDGTTSVSIDLPAYGTIVVVFSPETAALSQPMVAQRTEAMRSRSGWTVSFQPDRGAPQGEVHLDEFANWADARDARIRYFSGTAVYRARVSAPVRHPGEQVLLQFAAMRDVATVRINGHAAGTVWAMPLSVRVAPWLHAGENTIEIDVTNGWHNRVVGDLQPGAKHYTQTNIHLTADDPLIPSGIMGPLSWVIHTPEPQK